MNLFKYIAFGLIVLNSMSLLAQDPDYAGPAKIYVKSFWKNVAAFKSGTGGNVQNLDRGIKNTKEADPAYNTSVMEAEAIIWKEKANVTATAKQAEKDQEAQKIEDQNNVRTNDAFAKNDLEYLFKDANLQVGHNNLEFAQKRLDDFKAKTQNALKMTNPSQDYVRYISKFNGTMDLFYSRNKNLLGDITKVEDFQPAFMELQLYEAYWDAAQKIYPNESEFKSAYTKIVEYKKSIGSLNDVKKVSDKNDVEKIKNTKMVAATAKDAALEKYTSDAFNTRFGKVYGTSLQVILIQDGWVIEKNSLTGLTTGRYRPTQLAYKGNDGKCYLLSGILYIHEDYVGANFTNRTLVYDGLGGDEMLCENIK